MSTYTPIATQTLGSAAATVTFSSLPQNYTDLILVDNARTVTGGGDSELQLQFNSDTGSNYSTTYLYGNGSSAASSRATNQTSIWISRANETSGVGITNIQNYSNGTTYKTVLSRGNSTSYVFAWAGLWRNTNPITSIVIQRSSGLNLAAGSTFTIYGVAAGNSSAKASGGNIVTTDGTYWYHTFTSSGTFTPSQALTCDYLVVAGGGGGNNGRTGGGAGGFRTSIGGSALSLSANTVYQAIIGAGGKGGAQNSANYIAGAKGNNSIFSTITSTGGGGAPTGGAGNTGGSGSGGQPGGAGNEGGYSPVEGYAGGVTSGTAPSYGGAGGGGASAVGSNGSGSGGGAGGAGQSSSISGTSITYAGGGGGSFYSGGSGGSGTGGAGGAGGGGAGSNNTSVAGTSGTPNTGGGGGAGATSDINISGGGNGGSGIIIVRYAV